MEKSQNNDELILELKTKIQNQKKLLTTNKKFQPITNCNLSLNNNRYNINVLTKDELLLLIAQLQSLKTALSEVIPNETLNISGFSIDDFISDLKSKFENLNVKLEENRLKELENKLHNLLTLDTKVSLEINELMKEINGK